MAGDRGAAEWAAFALVCASAVLAGVLELLFLAEFYIGKVIVPVVIIAAVVGNLLFPRLAAAIVGGMRAAAAPVVLWLLVILVPTLYNRPEGDIFVLGTHGQQYAFYGLLFAGAIAGFATLVVLNTPSR